MTYSIVGRDPEREELGIAVQSRYFAVGRVVPWIEAGVGVIASQSFANPVYGLEGLRMLRAGFEPDRILKTLLDQDAGAATRQVAILDAGGRRAVHTGSRCVAAAGHALGENCCAQANMMTQSTVWAAMVRAFENAPGDLADRLLAALTAAEQEGGDVRGKQAAALVVVSTKRPDQLPSDRSIDLRVDDHADPLGELKRLLDYSRAHRLANRAIASLLANDPSGALADIEACCAACPSEPEFLFRRCLILLQLGHVDEAHEALHQAHSIHPGWSELLLRFADAGVLPVSREKLEFLVADLRHSGAEGP